MPAVNEKPAPQPFLPLSSQTGQASGHPHQEAVNQSIERHAEPLNHRAVTMLTDEQVSRLKCADLGVVQSLSDTNNINGIQAGIGRSALHYAVLHGSASLIDCLIALGADISIKDTSGKTSLHLLLDKIHIHDDSSQLGTKFQFIDELKLMLESGGTKINTQDDLGQTPLHMAASKVNPYVVGVLVDKNADVNKKDNQGYRPIELAIQCRYKTELNNELACAKTALLQKLSEDNCQIIKRLLQAGSEISWTINKEPTLHHFVRLEDAELFTKILNLWKQDIDCVDEQGNSALHIAAFRATLPRKETHNSHTNHSVCIQIIKLLVNASASYSLLNDDMKTPYNILSKINAANASDITHLFDKPERLNALCRNKILRQIKTRTVASSLSPFLPKRDQNYLSGKLCPSDLMMTQGGK